MLISGDMITDRAMVPTLRELSVFQRKQRAKQFGQGWSNAALVGKCVPEPHFQNHRRVSRPPCKQMTVVHVAKPLLIMMMKMTVRHFGVVVRSMGGLEPIRPGCGFWLC